MMIYQSMPGYIGKFLCFCVDDREEKPIRETCFIYIQGFWNAPPNFPKKTAEVRLQRFPLLKRNLATAQLIFLPTLFPLPTGRFIWNQICFIRARGRR